MRRFLVFNNPSAGYAFMVEDERRLHPRYRQEGYYIIAEVMAVDYPTAYRDWFNRRNAVGGRAR